MHLSDSNGVEPGQEPLPHFWNIIHRVAITLDLNPEQIAEMMEVTPYRLRVMQRLGKEPTVSSAMAFSKRINVGFDSLVLNKFDYKLMAQQFSGDRSALPEKYGQHALSKRRTVIPFLDYIEKYFGWEQRALILRRFQMTEGMFTNPDSMINVRFAVDLTDYLMTYYRNAGVLEHMGWFSATSSRSTPFGIELGKADTVGGVYERAFEEYVPKYFEKNYSWRLLNLDDNSCIVEGRPSDEFMSTPGSQDLLSLGVCTVRTGFLSSMPNYANLLSARVKKTACVTHGDSACQYHIHFNDVEATA